MILGFFVVVVFVFLLVKFQARFSLSSFTLVKRLFSSSSVSSIRVVSSNDDLMMNNLLVFPSLLVFCTFFNLSLNFAIRSS